MEKSVMISEVDFTEAGVTASNLEQLKALIEESDVSPDAEYFSMNTTGQKGLFRLKA